MTPPADLLPEADSHALIPKAFAFSALRQVVAHILEQGSRLSWSVQGLGMFRIHLKDGYQLHLWDDRWYVPNATRLHTHPWNFHSLVVAGQMRYSTYAERDSGHGVQPYKRVRIRCGEGGGIDGDYDPVNVGLLCEHIQNAGRSYDLARHEIHDAYPENGTITLVRRWTPEGESPDHAYVYCPMKSPLFLSAEPRPARPEEIDTATSTALERWFGESEGLLATRRKERSHG